MFNCNKHVGDFPLRVICPKLVRELFWFWLLEIIISHFLGNIKYLAFLPLKKTCCIVFKYFDGKLKFSPQFLNNTCIQMYFIITFHICVYSGFFLMQRGPNWIFKIYKLFELNELHLYTECYECTLYKALIQPCIFVIRNLQMESWLN